MIPILPVLLAATLILGPLTDTLLVIPEGAVLSALRPIGTPPTRIDTFQSFGAVRARVVDTVPEWGFRMENRGGKHFLRIRSSRPLSFELTLRDTSVARPAGLRDTLDLLIVAPRRFHQAVLSYKTLRERDGVRTEVVDLEDILNRGSSPALALQRYLQERAAQQVVRHVFLVGPVPEVPLVHTRVDGIYEPLPFYERVPTDVFFAYQYGSWNTDGDTLMGEVEDGVDPRYMVRLFNIGRLVVPTPEAFLQYAAKVDRYLHTPRPDIRYVLHGPRIAPSLYGSTYLQPALTYLPPDVKPVELFEENATIPEDTFFARLRDAALVLGVAHGYNDLYQINYSPWVDARISRFVMDSTYGPFVFYPVACELLAFDEGALGVASLTGDGGPVAVYGMARLDFPDYSQYIALWFMQALQNGAQTLGDVDAFARENLRMYTGPHNSVPRYLFFGYTLLGDPSLPVFTHPLEPLAFHEGSLMISRTPGGWRITGGIPQSRLVVENAEVHIFQFPYDVLLPSIPAPRLRLVLPGTIPAETLLTPQPDERPVLEVIAPPHAATGDTLVLQIRVASPVPGSLRFTSPETSFVSPVSGADTIQITQVPELPGRHVLSAALSTPEGELEARHEMEVFSSLPSLAGVLVDSPDVRVVLEQHPEAWRGGILVANGDTLTLPAQGSPPLWVSPPLSMTGETLVLNLEVRNLLAQDTLPLQDTLDRSGALETRAVPGGLELFASDSVCEAYALPDLSRWLPRDALPHRLEGGISVQAYCVRARVGRSIGLLAGAPGPPVRPPYPVRDLPLLTTQTGPVPGRFLDLSAPSVVLVGQDGRMHVLDPVAGVSLAFFPPETPTSEVFRDAVRADLDGNGMDDLVFVQRDPGGFRGLFNGQAFFVSAPVSVVRTPFAWDLDGDGKDEVYTTSGRALLRLHTQSSPQVDTFALLSSGSWTTRTALAPGDTALLAGAVAGNSDILIQIRPDGTLDTLFTLPYRVQDLAVGDVAPDPGLEIVAVASDSVRILNNGSQVGGFPVTLRAPDPALVDWDGDGLLDVALKVHDSTGTRYQVVAYRYDGTELFRSPESWMNGLSFPTPLAGCTGRLVYGNRGDNLYLWGGEPHDVFMGHKLGSGVFLSTGGALWVASFLGPLWVLETGITCAPADWRTAYHDLRRTANASVEDLPTPVHDRQPRILLGQLPGVLRASSTPMLLLPGVRLFDPSGRLLGENRIRLRGLPPGIYIFRSTHHTRRVVVLP